MESGEETHSGKQRAGARVAQECAIPSQKV
jgi:hypothetical protein